VLPGTASAKVGTRAPARFPRRFFALSAEWPVRSGFLGQWLTFSLALGAPPACIRESLFFVRRSVSLGLT